jgi:hypothetical protein
METGLETNNGLDLDANGNGYDYQNQAWVINGKYYPCGHVGTQHECNCYGRNHSGEPVRTA